MILYINGESEGQPRQYEYYEHKIEDFSAAVDYLAQRDDIDENRLDLSRCISRMRLC